MSWLPLYNAWVVMVGILSIFLWNLGGVLFFFFVVLVSVIWLIKESLCSVKHYATGFWMFIVSEVVVFGTLFDLCILTVDKDVEALSSPMELPLVGCFILTGSSITVTAYHHYLGSEIGRYFLLLTIVLGFSFLCLQVFEFYDCECDMTFCIYQAVCFSIVGLHFLHVFGGVLALSLVYLIGEDFISKTNIDFVVWYWHFVDYIWLFVYLMIYLA